MFGEDRVYVYSLYTNYNISWSHVYIDKSLKK